MMVMEMTGIEQHYKLSEAAKLCDVSTRTLRRWIKDGRIKAASWETERGFEYRIPASELVKNFGFSPEEK